MKRGVGRGLIIVAVLVLVLSALPAVADSQARIVRVSELSGQVDIDRNTGQGFERAILNMPVTQGMELETGTDGRAEIEFEDGSTIRLTPETRVSFPRLSLRSSGARINVVELQEGAAYFDVNQKGDNEFTVSLGNRDLEVVRSSHFRIEFGDVDARVAVFKGELRTRGDGEEVAVKKNETLTLDLADGGRYQLAQGVDQSQYDDWDRERAEYDDRYRDTDTYSRYGYSSSYSPYYGWSDLNYYGSFIDMPGYGYMWRPYGVSYMWDPFSDGAWVWYPGWGYTWVSYYPWGWMPYRYGSWTYIPSYGWYWRPGSAWNNWYGFPRYYNPPHHWHRPDPPSAPNRPTIFIGRPAPAGAIGSGPVAKRHEPPNRRLPGNATGNDAGVNRPPRNPGSPGTPVIDTPRGPVRSKTIDNDTIDGTPARRDGIRPGFDPGDRTRGTPTNTVQDRDKGPVRTPPAPPTRVAPVGPAPRIDTPKPVSPRVDTPRGGDHSTPRVSPPSAPPRSSSGVDRGPRMSSPPPPPPPMRSSSPAPSSGSRSPKQ